MTERFDEAAVSSAESDNVIGVRAGADHKFTPVWAVVVDGRVFIRSWGLSGHGWHEAFADDPHGAAELGGRQFDVRADLVGDANLLEAVDEAYRKKYHTPGSAKFVDDINSPRSRATTTELVPA